MRADRFSSASRPVRRSWKRFRSWQEPRSHDFFPPGPTDVFSAIDGFKAAGLVAVGLATIGLEATDLAVFVLAAAGLTTFLLLVEATIVLVDFSSATGLEVTGLVMTGFVGLVCFTFATGLGEFFAGFPVLAPLAATTEIFAGFEWMAFFDLAASGLPRSNFTDFNASAGVLAFVAGFLASRTVGFEIESRAFKGFEDALDAFLTD